MKQLIGLLLLFSTTVADAAIYHYKYEGYDLDLVHEPDYEFFENDPYKPPIADPTRPGFNIDMWIDTAYLPGNTLTDFGYECDYAACVSYGINGAEWSDSTNAGNLLKVTGNNDFDYWQQAVFSFAGLTFDAEANLVDWNLGVGFDGPLHGPSTTTSLDRIEEWYSDRYQWEAPQPGSWELVSTTNVPEINAEGSGLAIALLLCIALVFSERNRFRTSNHRDTMASTC